MNSSVQNSGADNTSDADPLDTEQEEEIVGTDLEDETQPQVTASLKIEAISELDLTAAVADPTSSSRKSNTSKLNFSF